MKPSSAILRLLLRAPFSLRRRHGIFGLACFACLHLAQPGFAQNTSADDDPFMGIEEFIVTGQSGNLVGLSESVSVTAFDASELDALGAGEMSDLAAFTPNLEIRSAGGTSATFFIRGVGLNDFSANASGAIAIYQDDIGLNSPALQLGQLFDIEQVNVLRGPQGSGPGRNASGGAIYIHSRKPTGDFSARFRTEIGVFDGRDAISRDFEGAVEAPIIPDILSARIAFRANIRDGIIRNRCGRLPPLDESRVTNPNTPLQGALCNESVNSSQLATVPNPNPDPNRPQLDNFRISGIAPGLERSMNNVNNWAARLQFRLQPPDTDMDWIFNVHGGRVDQLARVGVALGTTGNRFTEDGVVKGYLGGTTATYRQPEITDQLFAIRDSLGFSTAPPAERRLITGEAQRLLGTKLAKNLDSKPFEGDFNRTGDERMTTIGGFIRGEFDLGNVHFTTITGVEHYDRENDADSDFTPNRIFETNTQDTATQFTQDFRLEGELESQPLSWNAGGYFLYEDLDFESLSAAGSTVVSLTRLYDQETLAFGVYAGFEWEFLEDLTLETGVRYNWEQKKFDIALFRGGRRDICGPPLPPASPGAPVGLPGRDCSDRIVEQSPTGTINLTYHFSEETSAYWKYSRGWKGWQLNAGGASGVPLTVADPESIDAFEVGFSGSWLDGRLSLTGALFYYLYEDYQVFTFQNEPNAVPQRIVINASNAQNYGAEIEGNLTPLEGLDLSLRFAWLESEFLEFSQRVFRQLEGDGPGEPTIAVPVDLDFTGNRLPNSPRFTASGSVKYQWDLGGRGFITPRYDFAWSDDITFDQSNGRGAPNDFGETILPDNTIGQRAFMLHNMRLAYETPDGDIELALWVRNMTNELYKRVAFDASQVGLVGAILGDPRTYGFTLTLEW